jgi:hypothetical protein
MDVSSSGGAHKRTHTCAHTFCTYPSTGGIYSSVCDHVCVLRWCHRPVARVGRRCEVDTLARQRAVGCAIWAHVRDRRRRRHLRHRRRRQQHLQGRVGEHRQRCGPLTGLARVPGGLLRGYLQVPVLMVLRAALTGTHGNSRDPRRVLMGARGHSRALKDIQRTLRGTTFGIYRIFWVL